MGNELADELRRIRGIRGSTLREVEKATKISNAYLSQLERGEAKNPSPHKLYKLAKYYSVPYEILMKLAGYFHPGPEGQSRRTVSVLQAALMSVKLSPDEEEKVAEYIEFLRFENKKRGKS